MAGKRVLWLPHSTNPVMAGVRYRCIYPAKSLYKMGICSALADEQRNQSADVIIIQSKWMLDSKSEEECVRKLELVQLLKKRMRIVIDSFDNYFYNPTAEAGKEARLRYLMVMLQEADALVTASHTLADVVKLEAPANTEIWVIGDPVETPAMIRSLEPSWKRLNPKRLSMRLSIRKDIREILDNKQSGSTNFIWFGNHGSKNQQGGMLDLLELKKPLEKIAMTRKVSLTVLSNSKTKFENAFADWSFPTKYMEWNRLTAQDVIRAHDIALLPISKNPFTECKGNNRLTLALSLGLGVAASSIPSYEEFRDFCLLDQFGNLGQWVDNDTFRKQQTLTGKEYVNCYWNSDVVATHWRRMIDSVAS